MGVLIIVAVLLILGAIFNRMLKVNPTPVPQQEAELNEEADGWSVFERAVREIENGGNKEFVNSERGENAPPAFYGYNNGSEMINPMNDSSEKVTFDFSPDTYVFGESFQNRDMERESIENELQMAKSISFKKETGSVTKIRQAAVNFNFRDAVIFSAILNPKFKEENPQESEILI